MNKGRMKELRLTPDESILPYQKKALPLCTLTVKN
jgi:hypothetical protein